MSIQPTGVRPRVLLLSPFLYGEGATSGGAVLSYAQMKQLALGAELAFLGFSGIDTPDSEARQRRSLAALCSMVAEVPLRIGRVQVLRARLGSIGLRQPELAALCRTPAMEQALRRMLDEFRPDLVWIQFPQMAQYVELCGGVPCVMDVQDAYTLSGFRLAQRRQGRGAWLGWLDWVCWSRYEARHYARFAAVLTLSEQDAHVLHAMNPAVPAASIGLPLGASAAPSVAAVTGQVGFAGSFGHRPNLEGLDWFLKQVWPRVRSEWPEARFVVAGRNPPAGLVAEAGPGVEFAGFVPDILDFYAANAVTVVPLLSGGGVKIKTVEAMLAGSAIVSTRIGVEGTGAGQGEHALVEDDAAAFARAVVRVLADNSLRARLSAQARAHAGVLFSSDAWRERVAGVLRSAMEVRHGC